MAKKHRNRKQRGPHRTAIRRSHTEPSHPTGSSPPDPLIRTLREALRAPDPTAFWVSASPIVTVLEEPGELNDQLPAGVDLLQSFIDVNIAETTALLHMVAAMSKDDLFPARSRRALASRRQPVPPQITGLSQATVSGTQVFSDAAGDNHLVELTLPGEVRATLVVYVTRFPHLYFKDAFVLGERLDRVRENFARIMAADGFDLADTLRTLEPAQMRASLEQALAGIRPDVAKEPEEGDQWPMLRPFVEFVLSLLPEGGQGYDEHGMLVGQDPGSLLVGSGYHDIAPPWGEDEAPWGSDGYTEPAFDDDELAEDAYPPWIDEDGTDLAEAFLSSPEAADLQRGDLATVLLRYLMIVSADQTGDPLVWDAELVRWLLEDALPADPIISPEMADEVPAVLPALIAWSHRVTEADPGMTEALQRAMALQLRELPHRRADPRMRAERSEALVDLALSSGDADMFQQALLAQRVGGIPALHDLDSEPLPVERLDLEAVPEDVVERMQEIDAALVAGLGRVGEGEFAMDEAVLGDEFRTACRRFLAQVAAGDAGVLRRRASARTTAAAVAWIVGRGNDLVGYPPAPVRTGELLHAFDVKNSPSSRAETLMRAAVLPQSPVNVSLGSPDLLVSSARATIIAHRDRLQEDEPDT